MSTLKFISAQEAVQCVVSNSRVFVQGSAATPVQLITALLGRKAELHGVEIVSISTLGPVVFSKETMGDSFFINSLFVSPNTRDVVNGTGGDYVPVFSARFRYCSTGAFCRLMWRSSTFLHLMRMVSVHWAHR